MAEHRHDYGKRLANRFNTNSELDDFLVSSEMDQTEVDLFEGYQIPTEDEDCFPSSATINLLALRPATARGVANPSFMEHWFWKYMIMRGRGAWHIRTKLTESSRNLRLPIWCFDRWGATRTRLPDGRIVCIGGEHEDFYDPDFCIYNDVVVIAPPHSIDPPPEDEAEAVEPPLVSLPDSSSESPEYSSSSDDEVRADEPRQLFSPEPSPESEVSDPPPEEEPRAEEPYQLFSPEPSPDSGSSSESVDEQPPLLTPNCITIYGYPTDVFPPTDFHTSTLITEPRIGEDYILIIGALGYPGAASRRRPEIFRLNLDDFSIHRAPFFGAYPDYCLYEHTAELVGDDEQRTIEIVTKSNERYSLRIRDMTWFHHADVKIEEGI